MPLPTDKFLRHTYGPPACSNKSAMRRITCPKQPSLRARLYTLQHTVCRIWYSVVFISRSRILVRENRLSGLSRRGHQLVSNNISEYHRFPYNTSTLFLQNTGFRTSLLYKDLQEYATYHSRTTDMILRNTLWDNRRCLVAEGRGKQECGSGSVSDVCVRFKCRRI